MAQQRSEVKRDLAQPPFIIKVINDHGVWVAECDELGLVSEAGSYEELTEKVWEIAPELYLANHLGDNPEGIMLTFIQEQPSDSRMAL
ncbi:TPA: DUF1902 domain-containing protein [Yersinia enterocolitica]|nr:DUF1902 domain-containing protein [Yersinia enterocolitica]HDL7653938.1 DUF1902 domain-containing protein [Yersinia enterocolitica]HDL7691779.1 DUF1902 domain-containing protein [Yersinia enterocolitica]